MLRATFLLLLITNILPGTSYSAQLKMKVVSSMERVFQDVEYSGTSEKIILKAARNEYESAQVALFAKDEVVIDKVIVTELKNSVSGYSISKNNCTVRMPEYVYVEWNTRATPKEELDRSAPGWFPDPLPDFSPLTFSDTRSIFITCYIPENQPAGLYQGDVNITVNSELKSIPIEIRVWGFSLPNNPTIYTSNWLHPSQLIKQYGIRKNSEEYWELIDLVADDMKKHRQNVIFTRLNLIKTIKQKDGNYIFDYSDYEKWVKIFLNHGFQAIEAGPLFHPKAFHIVSEQSGNKIKFNKHNLKEFLQSKDGQKFLSIFFQALNKKNKELGIEKIYLQHIGDEAKLDERILYRELVRIVHKNMPGVPVIDATELPQHQRQGMMDIAVTNLAEIKREENTLKGKQWGAWWYTAGFNPRGKMPNRFIDYPLVKMRMLSWLSWKYEISGYLHYAYNWWQLPSKISPWLQTQYSNYAAGDGWIVYPPQNKIIQAPVSSLRWEAFRDGLEDYEYFILLENNLENLKAVLIKDNDSKIVSPMIHKGVSLLEMLDLRVVNKTRYPKNSESVNSIRIQIGDWLHKVSKYFSISNTTAGDILDNKTLRLTAFSGTFLK